jgi:hypothetical protein
MATYGAIASEFRRLSDGNWLMTGYTLGYCVSLPLVSHELFLAPFADDSQYKVSGQVNLALRPSFIERVRLTSFYR